MEAAQGGPEGGKRNDRSGQVRDSGEIAVVVARGGAALDADQGLQARHGTSLTRGRATEHTLSNRQQAAVQLRREPAPADLLQWRLELDRLFKE